MSRQTKEYAKKLVAQMTVEEKMSQMLYESPAIERLNIPAYNWWNQLLCIFFCLSTHYFHFLILNTFYQSIDWHVSHSKSA